MNRADDIGLQVCSACRGDYEDPDASVADERTEPEDDEESDSMSEEFPERRERR